MKFESPYSVLLHPPEQSGCHDLGDGGLHWTSDAAFDSTALVLCRQSSAYSYIAFLSPNCVYQPITGHHISVSLTRTGIWVSERPFFGCINSDGVIRIWI